MPMQDIYNVRRIRSSRTRGTCLPETANMSSPGHLYSATCFYMFLPACIYLFLNEKPRVRRRGESGVSMFNINAYE